MKVGFAASSDFLTMRLASDVAAKIEALPDGSTVFIRKGKIAALGMFETLVETIAKKYGHVVLYCQPDGNDRSAVYRRDYELVESVDRVEAYFAPDRIMDGGTGHLVEAAIAKGIPVYAWTVSGRGLIIRVGEFEPHNIP